jgi:hypothetical protein
MLGVWLWCAQPGRWAAAHTEFQDACEALGQLHLGANGQPQALPDAKHQQQPPVSDWDHVNPDEVPQAALNHGLRPAATDEAGEALRPRIYTTLIRARTWGSVLRCQTQGLGLCFLDASFCAPLLPRAAVRASSRACASVVWASTAGMVQLRVLRCHSQQCMGGFGMQGHLRRRPICQRLLTARQRGGPHSTICQLLACLAQTVGCSLPSEPSALICRLPFWSVHRVTPCAGNLRLLHCL